MKLIDDWKKARKFWSVRLAALGTALTSVFIIWPDSALYLWGAMPDEVKQLIPERFTPLIGVIIFTMSIIARVVKQDIGRKDNE